MFLFRPHQTRAIEKLLETNQRITHVEMCVASGKSHTMAGRAARYSGRSLILAHTDQLVRQNLKACGEIGLSAVPCSRKVGVNTMGRVTVGTIQTVVRRLSSFDDVGLVIIDETHLVPPDEQTQYRKLLARLSQATVNGFTGTPFRADGSGSLEDSFGPCVYRYTFSEALDDRYVKPLRQIDAEADDIDTAGLKVRHGEWERKELAHRGIELAPVHARAALKALNEEGRNRTLVFACDIEHAETLAREFNAAAGYRVAAAVHSEVEDALGDRLLTAFRSGALRILVSVQKFTTGFDVPDIDSLVFCRAIRSIVYYLQGLGRGARLTPHALDCVVIDFGGNVGRHGALDMIKPVERVLKTSREREEAIKRTSRECKACGSEYAKFFTSCPHCGYDPSAERSVGSELKANSSAQDLLADAKVRAQWIEVNGPPVRTPNRHWRLPLKGGYAIWWPAHLPAAPTHAYVSWSSRYGFVADGIIDANGHVFNRA